MYVVGGVMDSAVLDVGGCADFFYSATGWTVALYFQGTYLILVKRIFAIRFATWLYTK